MRITIVEFVVNAPPLEELSIWQKLGRILGVALVLIAACVIAAFLGAIFLEAYQQL